MFRKGKRFTDSTGRISIYISNPAKKMQPSVDFAFNSLYNNYSYFHNFSMLNQLRTNEAEKGLVHEKTTIYF
jgi:hypothetical protein